MADEKTSVQSHEREKGVQNNEVLTQLLLENPSKHGQKMI